MSFETYQKGGIKAIKDVVLGSVTLDSSYRIHPSGNIFLLYCD